jgi:hypothetical protein
MISDRALGKRKVLPPAFRISSLGFACAFALLAGCGRTEQAGEPPNQTAPKEIWKEFSAANAFDYTKKLVAFGPRPSGTLELAQTRAYLVDVLQKAGWQVDSQKFTGDTPHGPIQFINLIARFPEAPGKPAATTTQQAIVASHYDTKFFDTIRFLGASDGGSSTGALLELARVLALDPAMARKVELVFFDGEEAVVQFTDTDGLYGSRYYAHELRASKRNTQFKFGILWDMIGKKNLSITLPPNSPPHLAKDIFAAADALGQRSHFTYLDRDLIDDHVPLNESGIPSIDLIDFDYIYWHTADDLMDKLSPDSLQIVGSVTLYCLKQRLTP